MASAIAFALAGVLAAALAIALVWNARLRRAVVQSREVAAVATKQANELGSYRLVARLGSGASGEVWRAEHQLLARQAAIKLIRGPAHREQFQREAQVLATMRSRHTVQLYDYGVATDGTFYYVMELLDGLDLESLVVKHGAQPAARVIPILVGACASLAEAHDAGLLHRDLKPSNLMLSRAGDELDLVKVVDYEIARLEPSPDYMAPEHARGETLDGRADLYSLGCVARWLLAGDHARGAIPDELGRVIDDCVAPDREARPATARVLAERLRAIAIAPDDAWTQDRAAAWWKAHRPARAPTAPAEPIKVVVRQTLS